jgi:glycosyltransferase involved in cell wall biosynthesis
MKADPIVSVILPAYNAEKYIGDAITSVCNQTYNRWELIIVDDGSVDGTSKIASDFCHRDPRIRLVSRENGKLPKARNTGIAAAAGDFVAFLDADDSWHPSKLEKQIRAHRETGAEIIFSDANHISDESTMSPTDLFGVYSGFFTGEQMFRRLYERNSIPVSSVLLTLKQKGSPLRFLETKEVAGGAEDYELWLRLSSQGATFFGSSEKLVNYRSHAGQMSRHRIPMIMSAIAVHQRHQKVARRMGINVWRQNRIDNRELLHCGIKSANKKAARLALLSLFNPCISGIKGPLAAGKAVLGLSPK